MKARSSGGGPLSNPGLPKGIEIYRVEVRSVMYLAIYLIVGYMSIWTAAYYVADLFPGCRVWMLVLCGGLLLWMNL